MQFAVPATGSGAYWTLAAITLLAALAPLALIRRDGMKASARNGLMVLAVIVPITGMLAYALTENRVEVGERELTVRAAFFYQYTRPIGDFDLDRARVGRQEAIVPANFVRRENGVRLPGFAAGHFLNRQREPVFALVTDREKVVYLPSRNGSALVLSVERPEVFLAALRRG